MRFSLKSPWLIGLGGAMVAVLVAGLAAGAWWYYTPESVEDLYREVKLLYPDTPEMEVGEALVRLNDNTRPFLFVDVRTAKERDVSFIPQSITKNQFEQYSKSYRKAVIVAYCTIGLRSARFVDDLRKRGFDAYNLKGSLMAWTHAGGPVVDGMLRPTKRVHVYAPRWRGVGPGFKAEW